MIVQKWQVAEITLHSSVDYESPFTEVDVTATFTSPRGETITRPAFWDGGDVWKVRFAPDDVGGWQYTTETSDRSNAGLTQTGVVIGTPYRGNLDVYKHGFLKVSESGRDLAFADGKPFFYLDDTHRFLSQEQWAGSDVPGVDSQFKAIIDKRVEQGYTAIQSEPDGHRLSLCNASCTVPDLTLLKDYDKKVEYIASKGLVHNMGLGAYHHTAELTEQGAERLARLFVARYGAYPVTWFTAQEVDLAPVDLQSVWMAAAEEIDRADDYNHPQSVHQSAGVPKSPWVEQPWHDFTMIQGGHNTLPSLAHYKQSWDYSPVKPFLESELNYEGLRAQIDASTVRMGAYRAILAGGLGYSYGAQGIWNVSLAGYGQNVSWWDGLHAAGGEDMGILKDVFTSLDWSHFEPRFTDPAWVAYAHAGSSALASVGSDSYLGYFYNRDPATGLLKQLDTDHAYRATWIDPSTGSRTVAAANVTPSTAGTWCMPPKPTEADWLLLVEKAGSLTTAPAPEPECAGTDDGAMPNPVGEWHFDAVNNGLVEDASGAGNDAALHGGASIVPRGIAGGALSLDGVDGFAEIADTPELDGFPEFTLSVWANLNGVPGANVTPLGKEDSVGAGGGARFLVLPTGAGHFVAATSGSPWYSAIAVFSQPLTPGAWKHLVAVYDGQQYRMYVDGVETGASGRVSGTLKDIEDPWRFGHKSADNLAFMDGLVDEARIYDRALTDEQVTDLYQSYLG
ncbi:hypothetical protein QF046_001652 [Microbacterium sp. W4I4]|uniref:apiosidase-like domain-containing protein n=1 Tax=Microbacterium sp. W4I4 TaxID=3042295 RepID=UPI0027880620|nr:DUF4038 domain-containing protein [Microbacterium sp. W4I4]MDQ0614011.1 hypothetical protein [Microbacterium sp. W4I4]